MHEITRILEQVNSFKKNRSVVWFRGHSHTEYRLNSGLYRINNDQGYIKQVESNLYNSFINYGDSYCSIFSDKKSWNVIFLMQHHGLYTRLLDWTDSFTIALYFAVQENPNSCIWMLDPIKLNQYSKPLYSSEDKRYAEIGLLTLETLPTRIDDYINYFEQDIDIGSFAILPRRNNGRLVSQSGFFTVQGTACIPLEKEYRLNDCLQKIELPLDVHQECLEFLKINGINYYTLFGGVDGLCKYIKNELFDIELKNI